MIVLRDVTERKNREQRLSVLTRVLRHNLRNDMNLVNGHASTLAEQLEGDAAERAAEIESVAIDLVELSEKARNVEEMLASTSGDSTRETFAAIVGETVDDVTRRYPDVDFSVDLEDGIRVPEARSRRSSRT